MTLEELFTKEYESLKKEKADLIKGLKERDQEIKSLRDSLDAETKLREGLERFIMTLGPRQVNGYISLSKTFIGEDNDFYESLLSFVRPGQEPDEAE